MLEAGRAWLPLKDCKTSEISRKLHDGISSNQAETVVIIIESSGSEGSTAHIIDNTYKQLKSTTDFYKHLISKISNESLGYVTLDPNELLVKDYLMRAIHPS
ncbi:unnamed protein product [Mucor fragilis]